MTLKYGVIGHPIAHSQSPLIHTAFADQLGIALSYERVLAPVDDFEHTVHGLIKQGFNGLNVTVPFKFRAYGLCDVLSDDAKAAKAVNTMSFKQGQIVGDNTDGVGLLNDITQNLHLDLMNKQVLLMGAGGAAYGVVLPLLKAGARLFVANRSPEKAVALAHMFNEMGLGLLIHASGYDAVQHLAFDVIINATASGLGNEAPPMTAGNFKPQTLAYDMMYGKETMFLQQARAWQAVVADGLGMLVEQAAEAFFIWHGKRPNAAAVIKALRQA